MHALTSVYNPMFDCVVKHARLAAPLRARAGRC